jgi:DNA-binding transcriptional LysR family regulator
MPEIDIEALARADINLLVAFEALMQEGSVTRAAQRLAVSQSALSHTLGRLRGWFGDELFVRSGRATTPTPVALRIREPVREALARIGGLLQPAAFRPEDLHATFRIRAFDFAQLTIIPRLAGVLAQRAPGVQLSAQSHGRDPVRALAEGSCDLALGLSREPHGPFQRTVSTERFVSVVRREHPCLREPLTIEAFAALSHAIVSPVGRPAGFVDAVLAERGLVRRVTFATPQLYSAALAVCGSEMVLTGAERVLRELARALPLAIVEPPVQLPPFHVVMTWHERRDRDDGHRWLRDLVLEVGREDPEPRAGVRAEGR